MWEEEAAGCLSTQGPITRLSALARVSEQAACATQTPRCSLSYSIFHHQHQIQGTFHTVPRTLKAR